MAGYATYGCKMLHIKKLDTFVAKQFGLLFIGTFFICQFVLMMQFLWQFVDDLIGKGLSMDVLAQFFGYMSVMFVPQAIPLAVLLSSLITFGNLGESSELTAIKASGISLIQTFRSLIFISCVLCVVSFYFQNTIAPGANMKIRQMLIAMKQKSPELEIPEGIFYDGIPNCNLYVQKKDIETGKLYGIMIYRMTGSYEDQAIILADSGMLQSTAEKKHLLLTLWSGEWFENMRSQELGNSASVPYRRETFVNKKILLDYDGDFSMADATSLSNNAQTKSLRQLRHFTDSVEQQYDSIGRRYYDEDQRMFYAQGRAGRNDSLLAAKRTGNSKYMVDSVYGKLSAEKKRQAVNDALSKVQGKMNDLEFKTLLTSDADKLIRKHKMESIAKFTLALQCLLFFFIGAPLGAIIRKGGLGMPVLVSVLVYILFYILDNTGKRMAEIGVWTIWFGKSLSLGVLAPTAFFLTYKANKDSIVFNIEHYIKIMTVLVGIRLKRHIAAKEVVITDPDYGNDALQLAAINGDIYEYSVRRRLKSAPNWIKVFFKYEPDYEIELINERLEAVIADLSNTRNRTILSAINAYPIVSPKAHTRPFERKWLNIAAAVIVPVGLILYFRMWRYRIRLYKDLRNIKRTSDTIIEEINS